MEKHLDRAVVLVSGGIDSATLLGYVAGRLHAAATYAVSFAYGQRHVRELEMAKWQASFFAVVEHRVIDMAFFGPLTGRVSALTGDRVPVPDLAQLDESQKQQPPTYVPNRNMTLLALAVAFAESTGSTDVFYGAQAQDEYGYWDCTREFVLGLNRVLALNRRNAVTVHAPFVGMRKAEVLKIGLELGVDYAHTWSCYRGEASACGTCPSCAERAAAFRELGIADPVTADR